MAHNALNSNSNVNPVNAQNMQFYSNKLKLVASHKLRFKLVNNSFDKWSVINKTKECNPRGHWEDKPILNNRLQQANHKRTSHRERKQIPTEQQAQINKYHLNFFNSLEVHPFLLLY